MKLYTKIGDKGTTSLLSMEKVNKDHPLLEAYGTFDELNSVIGVCLAHLLNQNFENAIHVQELCKCIQNDLFQLGSYLADPKRETEGALISLQISDKAIKNLEKNIDQFSNACPELKNFILPGSNILNAYFHLARTVTRRAERHLVTLKMDHKIDGKVFIYINRLSDLFFALARYCSYKQGAAEVLFDKNISVENLG